MRTRIVVAITAFVLLQGAAVAQAQYPPGVIARGVALNSACRAAGGQAVNGTKPFLVVDYDLTGDGRRDFILDESAFGCSTRSFQPGNAVEVFDGATGRGLYRGEAAAWQVLKGARPQVMLTLRGPVCSANAMATTTCQRPLVWNAQSRTLTGPTAPLKPGASVASAPPPGVTPPTAAAPAGAGMAVSEADKAAVFKAAGFKQSGRVWKRCEEDTPTASYRAGAIEEMLDLNDDGRPEVVVTESSLFCYGQEGAWFGIITKEANGSWREVLEADGVFVAMSTRANGWREVMVGGPGFTHPAYRYDGKQYVQNRMVRE